MSGRQGLREILMADSATLANLGSDHPHGAVSRSQGRALALVEKGSDNPSLANLANPNERSFETPSGTVTGKLTRVRVDHLSTDSRFKVRDIPRASTDRKSVV